jgi:hypothetical protein
MPPKKIRYQMLSQRQTRKHKTAKIIKLSINIIFLSAFTIEPLIIDDRVCISLTVPDVYIEKDRTDF